MIASLGAPGTGKTFTINQLSKTDDKDIENLISTQTKNHQKHLQNLTTTDQNTKKNHFLNLKGKKFVFVNITYNSNTGFGEIDDEISPANTLALRFLYRYYYYLLFIIIITFFLFVLFHFFHFFHFFHLLIFFGLLLVPFLTNQLSSPIFGLFLLLILKEPLEYQRKSLLIFLSNV